VTCHEGDKPLARQIRCAQSCTLPNNDISPPVAAWDSPPGTSHTETAK
jgi:hypothetical protein